MIFAAIGTELMRDMLFEAGMLAVIILYNCKTASLDFPAACLKYGTFRG